MKPPLVAGVDYYVENGKLVFTAYYHQKRGFCCNSKCRHCPYRLEGSQSASDAPLVIEISGVQDPGKLPPK